MFGLALTLGLSACMAAEDADFELVDEDEDVDESEEAVEFRVMHDTCGDDPGGGGPGCFQVCQSSLNFCTTLVNQEHWTRCESAVRAHIDFCDVNNINILMQTQQTICLNERTNCLNGGDPDYASVDDWYDSESASCSDGYDNCTDDC